MKTNIGNLIKKETQHWLDLLMKDRNFNIKEFREITKQLYGDILLSCFSYRRKILQSNRSKDELVFRCTKEDIEKTFLEPIDDNKLAYIELGMELNKWTLEELYKECQEFGENICAIASCRKRKALEV